LDIKRKLPWFPSDFYEGFHIQSISAILFIYLGCITNAITFGGLLGDATDNYQVESEGRGHFGLAKANRGEMGCSGFSSHVPCQSLMLGVEIHSQVIEKNHRIAQIGKDLKDHQVQPQPNHTTLTLTTLR